MNSAAYKNPAIWAIGRPKARTKATVTLNSSVNPPPSLDSLSFMDIRLSTEVSRLRGRSSDAVCRHNHYEPR